MSALSPTATPTVAASPRATGGARAGWALAALIVLAAALRLPTLGAQSLWYDEAFTAVHVFHPSLSATLSAMSPTRRSSRISPR